MAKRLKEQPEVELHVDKDGWTGGLQLNICHPKSGGYRIAGPKYNGSSTNVLMYRLTERDANEIRRYLDESFPPRDAG